MNAGPSPLFTNPFCHFKISATSKNLYKGLFMAKKIAHCIILVMVAMIYNTTPTAAMTMQELRANIDHDLRAEIRKIPLSELYSMQETDFPTENLGHDIGARSQKDKINSMPDFARRALYGNYARFMNEWLEDSGVRAVLRAYEKYTRLDLRVSIGETHHLLPSENQTLHDILLGTQMTMQPLTDNDFHLGLKFDPQGIDAERFNNFSAFIENDFAWLHGEVRYSNINNLSLILQRNSKASENFLDLLLEYKHSDQRLYLDVVYRLEKNWYLKLFGSYSPNEKNSVFMAIFRFL
jgi:hypothetical protein